MPMVSLLPIKGFVMLQHIKLKLSVLTATVGATNWPLKESVQADIDSLNAALVTPVTVGELVAVVNRLENISQNAFCDGQDDVRGYVREIIHAISTWRVG